MHVRFARCATWAFAIAAIAALGVVAFGPVAFIRGLGAVALVCALPGLLVNALVLHGARRRAHPLVRAPGSAVAERPRGHRLAGELLPENRPVLVPVAMVTHG